MKKVNKKNDGLLVLVVGAVCLGISLLINRYVEIKDIYCIILLVISLIIEIIGLYKIIKEK